VQFLNGFPLAVLFIGLQFIFIFLKIFQAPSHWQVCLHKAIILIDLIASMVVNEVDGRLREGSVQVLEDELMQVLILHIGHLPAIGKVAVVHYVFPF
jgi:hypothetical protein